MVLSLLGLGGLTQTNLYNQHCHDDGIESSWYTSPNGLQGTLNDHRPKSFPGYFSLFGLGDTDSISRKIIWTIYQYRVAPVALVLGNSHWVVVRGYEVNADPVSSVDQTYAITTFYLNDPGDGFGAKHSIPYATWLSQYMTGVPTGYWERQFLAVCDSDPPPTGPGRIRVPARRRHFRGERILRPERIGELALAGLAASGLFDRDSWQRILPNIHPANPILIQRLDRLDTFYYLVPMGFRRRVIALVCIDARFGDYLQAARLPSRRNAFRDLNFDPQVAVQILLARPIDFGRHGRLKVRKQAYALYPTLVWRPCRESMSPYLPFFMATVGNRRVYIRVDGAVFPRLHTHDRGI
jgi:hypothetical protein